jgi:hypothetical protein
MRANMSVDQFLEHRHAIRCLHIPTMTSPLPSDRGYHEQGGAQGVYRRTGALGELRIAGRLIPNKAVLINSIPLLEAQASSKIENIVTTTDRLFRFVDQTGNQTDPATEALRYRTALNRGFRSLGERPLSTATAVEVCRVIKGADLDIRATPGTALMNEETGRVVLHAARGAGAAARQTRELGTLCP